MPTDDDRQLSLLATFHYAYGAFIALGALLMLLVLFAGIGAALDPVRHAQGFFTPSDSLGWGTILIVTGALGFVGSALLSYATLRAAEGLNAHTGRSFCICVAAINSLSVPVGTVLGIGTIVTLMRPSVIELFEQRIGKEPRRGMEAGP